MMALYLPMDSVTGRRVDVDLLADYLELTAFFAVDAAARTSDLINAASLGATEDYADLDDEMRDGAEELRARAVNRVRSRQDALDTEYPFRLEPGGDVLACEPDEQSFGQAAYVLCLVLSNLMPMSQILAGSDLHPSDEEVRRLRQYFQYFATAALAGEMHGNAWSFGFPRLDGSGFLDKLRDIWRELRDGRIERQSGAPELPKDDQVDVFAARLHRDRLPGFLLAVGQVATGQDAARKSLKGHVGPFKSRWFGTQPVTEFLPYMIVPFATADRRFVDDVRVMGNVLHRLRVPRRVAEAKRLVEAGVAIEGYDRLAEVARWVADYRGQARAA
ncbi:MAG: hypothetical protein OXF93_00855 [Acidobacteria bacterium]|nr:hypothetical protein [Acidobacteriota bacterium]